MVAGRDRMGEGRMAKSKGRQAGSKSRELQIHDAAVAVFSRKGYAAASLQDIADSVGILKGSLYYYITSKEQLLFGILDQAHREAMQLMDEVDALQLPAEVRLGEFVRRITIFYIKNKDRSALYFSEWRHLTGDQLDAVLLQRKEMERRVESILREAKGEGKTRTDLELKVATFYLLTAVSGVVNWFRPGGSISAELAANEVADLSCAAVFRVLVLS